MDVIDKMIEDYLSGKSSREVADKYDVSKDKLLYHMKKRGIARRTKAEAIAQRFQEAKWRDKDYLYNAYVTEGKSSLEIASHLGCDHSVVLDWLHKFDISVRDLSESHIGNEPSNKGLGKRNSDEMVVCGCGCGQELKRYDGGSNERRFINGHRISGEAHPLYKPLSVNRKPRHDASDYRLWRKAVLEACDYTCQRCGVVGGKLESHHIKLMSEYPELSYVVENGQALCGPCHKQLHKEMRSAVQ